jgi:hypothetical protein
MQVVLCLKYLTSNLALRLIQLHNKRNLLFES